MSSMWVSLPSGRISERAAEAAITSVPELTGRASWRRCRRAGQLSGGDSAQDGCLIVVDAVIGVRSVSHAFVSNANIGCDHRDARATQPSLSRRPRPARRRVVVTGAFDVRIGSLSADGRRLPRCCLSQTPPSSAEGVAGERHRLPGRYPVGHDEHWQRAKLPYPAQPAHFVAARIRSKSVNMHRVTMSHRRCRRSLHGQPDRESTSPRRSQRSSRCADVRRFPVVQPKSEPARGKSFRAHWQAVGSTSA